MNNEKQNAFLIIAEVRAALINGVVHRDIRGKLLERDIEIVEALLADGEIELDVSARIQRTTTEDQLDKILKMPQLKYV